MILKDGRLFEAEKMTRLPDGIEGHVQERVIKVPTALIQDAVLASDANAPPPRDSRGEGEGREGDGALTTQMVPTKRRDELIAKKLADRRKRSIRSANTRVCAQSLIEETKAFRYEYTVPAASVSPSSRDAMEATTRVREVLRISIQGRRAQAAGQHLQRREELSPGLGRARGARADFRFVKTVGT
jgi:hypothetical protein